MPPQPRTSGPRDACTLRGFQGPGSGTLVAQAPSYPHPLLLAQSDTEQVQAALVEPPLHRRPPDEGFPGCHKGSIAPGLEFDVCPGTSAIATENNALGNNTAWRTKPATRALLRGVEGTTDHKQADLQSRTIQRLEHQEHSCKNSDGATRCTTDRTALHCMKILRGSSAHASAQQYTMWQYPLSQLGYHIETPSPRAYKRKYTAATVVVVSIIIA